MSTENCSITLSQQLKAESFWGRLKSQRLSLLLIGGALCFSVFLVVAENGVSGFSITNIFSGSFYSSPDKNQYQKRLELLSEEIVRVKRYEAELQRKAQEVDSAIAKAKQLSFSLKSNKKSSSSSTTPVLGVGGGDDDTVDCMVDRILTFGMAIDDKTGEVKTRSLFERLERLANKVNYTPIGTPVVGTISSNYGMRRNPFRGRRRWQMHKGIDLVAPWRTPIAATASGVVVKAAWSGGFGRMVEIDHGNGIKTRFGHLSRFKVKKGDKVTRGQIIGLLGSTGRSTGAHLHYEIRLAGKPVNPAPFIELSKTLATI